MVATTSFAAARERLISLTGLFVVLIAVFWALGGGGPVVVGALVIVGLIFTVADAVQWRAVQHDLAVTDGEPVPSVPWGFLVGPAGALGVLAALLAGAPVVAVLAAIALVAALPGAIGRLPATPRSYRVTAQARRIRRFVRAHGVAEGEPVPGYLVPLGEPGTRLFVLAPDGTWGDLMLRPDEPDDVVRLARIELVEATDPNAGGRLQIGPPLWHLMIRSW